MQQGTWPTATVASGGQTIQLGVLRLDKSASATTGPVRRTVTDSTTNQPIGNALVATSGGLSALTDGTGNYQIANVPPRTITAHASKSGYAPAGGTGSLAARGGFVLSSSLVPGAAFRAGGTLLG